MIGGVIAFHHHLLRLSLNLRNTIRKLEHECQIVSHVLPLCDPHKTNQFSLHVVVRHYKFVSKGMHEAYASLKKDGYAFKIWYDEKPWLKVPLPD